MIFFCYTNCMINEMTKTKVIETLRANPMEGNPTIARECLVSTSTVARIRKKLGLFPDKRIRYRNGKAELYRVPNGSESIDDIAISNTMLCQLHQLKVSEDGHEAWCLIKDILSIAASGNPSQ